MNTKIVWLLMLSGVAALGQPHQTNNLNVAATATNSAAYYFTGTNRIDVELYNRVGLELRFGGAGTATLTTWWVRSNDGTNYETTPLYSWTVPGNNTTNVIALTNFDALCHRYWKLLLWTNAGAADFTNLTLQSVLKGYQRDK